MKRLIIYLLVILSGTLLVGCPEVDYHITRSFVEEYYEVDDFEWNGSGSSPWGDLKPGVVNSSAVVGTIRPGSMKLADNDGDMLVSYEDVGRSVIGNADNPLEIR